MNDVITLQGRQLTCADIDFIRQLIAEHPKWSWRQLSIALSTAWHWRNAKGVLKDMACRSLAVKLHEREYIQLPARRQIPTSRMAKRHIPDVVHDTMPIHQLLSAQPSINHQQYPFSYFSLGQGTAPGESHIGADQSSHLSRLVIALWP